jgi:hypothetical protein
MKNKLLAGISVRRISSPITHNHTMDGCVEGLGGHVVRGDECRIPLILHHGLCRGYDTSPPSNVKTATLTKYFAARFCGVSAMNHENS